MGTGIIPGTFYQTGYPMLTDTKIRAAKPKDTAYRLTDSGGLHLFVTTAGGKLWRIRYEFAGKEKLLSVGRYPEMSLLEARGKLSETKAAIKQGVDPGEVKKSGIAPGRVTTFETLALEWFAVRKMAWKPVHADDVLKSLQMSVFPEIGTMAPRDITSRRILSLLRKIEERGAIETARRVRQRISSIFRFGVPSGICDTDPAAIVVDALAPIKKGNLPAIIDLEGVRKVMRDCDATAAHPATHLAMRFLALTS